MYSGRPLGAFCVRHTGEHWVLYYSPLLSLSLSFRDFLFDFFFFFFFFSRWFVRECRKKKKTTSFLFYSSRMVLLCCIAANQKQKNSTEHLFYYFSIQQQCQLLERWVLSRVRPPFASKKIKSLKKSTPV